MKQVKYLPLCKRHRAKPSKQRRKPVARAAASLEEPVRAADGEVFNLRYWRNLLSHIEDVVMVSVLSIILISILFYPFALGAATLIIAAATVLVWNYTGQSFIIVAEEKETMHWLWKIQLPLAIILASWSFGSFLSQDDPRGISTACLIISGLIGALSFSKRIFPAKTLVYMGISVASASGILIALLVGWQPGTAYAMFLLFNGTALVALTYAIGTLRANCENCVLYIENGFRLAPQV